MTEHDDEARLCREIDRLVDGELDVAERSRLFEALDASPEEWRGCALAFLEAREWRESLEPVAACARRTPDRVIAERSRARPWPGLVWAGLAGCVAIAFGLGFGLGAGAFDDSGFAPAPLVRDAGSAAEAPIESTLLDEDVSTKAAGSRDSVELVGVIQDPESERVLPIVSGPGLDEEWLRGLPPPLTDYDRQRLERQGFHVEQGRKFVSVEMRDGERVTIPIDLVNVQYVGQRIY